MKNRQIRKVLLLFTITMFVFSLVSCNTILKRPKGDEEKQSGEQRKEPPNSLTTMEQDTEKIIEEIQKVQDERAELKRQNETTESEPDEEEQKQQEDKQQGQQQQEGQQEQQGQQQGQQQQGQQSGQQQGQQQQQDKTEKPTEVKWSDMEETVKNLHSLWNNYEPSARKDGATDELITNFEVHLDAMTNQVMARNEEKTLISANKLYQYFPEFLNLYSHQAPPETKEILYYIREITISGQEDKWDETSQMLDSMKKAWQTAKARMEKPDKDLNQKIDFAIDDFARVVSQKNLHLTKMKGDILQKNIKEIK
jgi:hypothetical protein